MEPPGRRHNFCFAQAWWHFVPFLQLSRNALERPTLAHMPCLARPMGEIQCDICCSYGMLSCHALQLNKCKRCACWATDQALALVREPDNEYDPNAIRVQVRVHAQFCSPLVSLLRTGDW